MKKNIFTLLVIFTFPPSIFAQPQHFTFATNTGDSYSIVVSAATLDGSALDAGDEIGVFTPNGLCVGASAWDGTTPMALVTWVDDSQTPEVDGYAAGDTMFFKIWDQSSDQELHALPTYAQGNGTFGSGAFAQLALAAVSGGQVSGLLVTNTNDSGAQSLREAITLANSNPGQDTIRFAIPQSDPGFDSNAGTWTLQPFSALPVVTDSGLVIDGSSQADFMGSDSNPDGPEIVINGQQAGEVVGLHFVTSHNHVKHLVINGFRSRPGIQITADNISGNSVTGCYIGTNAAGTDTVPNWQGIYVDRAHDTTIGGSTPESKNLVSGNVQEAIVLSTGTHHNQVLGNLIGTDITGKAKLENGGVGVAIFSGSHHNIVGGSEPGERNIISGNFDGVRIWGNHNTVIGNYIGTDITGTEVLGNTWDGVSIQVGTNNIIGGLLPGEGNILSGNEVRGVVVTADSNKIIGNYVGTDTSGSKDLGNKAHGVSLTYGANNNIVGPKNIIAFNQWSGVFVNTDSSFQNTITQNSINRNLNFGIGISDGANGNIARPDNMTFITGMVSGSAPPNCIIEIFSDEEDEGEIYEGMTTADNNGDFQWTFTPSNAPSCPYITATATDAAGNTSGFSSAVLITSVEDARETQVPQQFSLSQNYPNPFNPETVIRYGVPEKAHVIVRIFNLLGAEVATLVDKEQNPGVHSVTWNGTNQHGLQVASGVYLYRLEAVDVVVVKSMLFLK